MHVRTPNGLREYPRPEQGVTLGPLVPIILAGTVYLVLGYVAITLLVRD